MRQSGGHMRHSEAEVATVQEVRFGLMTEDEINRYTIDEITSSQIYDRGLPVEKGLNDLRLGINNNSTRCRTCKETRECPGHFGRIRLEEPVFHYGFLPTIVKILKCICLNCSNVRYPLNSDIERVNQLSRSQNSRKKLNQLSKLLSKVKVCSFPDPDQPEKQLKYCGNQIPSKISISRDMKIELEEDFQEAHQKERKRITNYINAARVLHILERMSAESCETLGFVDNKPRDLIIRTLLVCPPQVRPSIEMNPVRNCEDDITLVYGKVIEINNRLKGGVEMTHILRDKHVEAMERMINSIMDKSKAKKAEDGAEGIVLKVKEGGKAVKSITQRLKGKEGRFRQHLMGKRVDFSARSVISPDSCLALDELGVPQKIAAMLSFPEQITSLNFERIVNLCLAKKVLYVLKPTEDKKRYEPFNVSKFEDRKSIEAELNYGMIAERVLQDGDYVLFNRQPTLHRMSMMGHRVRVLPHSTFRLNLSVCAPYNADFDGDQMNMHVPQSYESLAELKHIAHVPNQIVTPKNNAPVMGIVQDSLLGIYLFTLRSTFLTREQVMNLVIWIEDFEGDLPLPAIIKPEPLWSGKQVISLIINKRINMAFMKDDLDKLNPKDNSIIIDKGELLTGALNKEIIGSGAGGLVHISWLDVSPASTCEFMTVAQRIVNAWLVDQGFTCGASDVVPPAELKRKMKERRAETQKIFQENFKIFFSQKLMEEKNMLNRSKRVVDSLQIITNEKLNKELREARNIVEQNVSPFSNNIYKMIFAKSKGSETNLTQILGMLGNQNVDGQRLPQGFHKRALPHFLKDDYSPEPRGFIYSSFYEGLKAHQFFFHSMSGRQGLSDTAVKTSRTGYIQRKLIKALEDVITRYDGTVRDSQEGLVQRLYGEDGMSAQFIEHQKVPVIEYDNAKFAQVYRWDEGSLRDYLGQIKRSDQYSQKSIAEILSREYQLLLRGREKLRELFVVGGAINNVYAPVKLERIINHAKQKFSKSTGIESRLHPAEVITGVEEALDDMLPPRFSKQFTGFPEERRRMFDLNAKQRQQFEERLARKERESGVELIRILIRTQLASKVICASKLPMEAFRDVLEQIKVRYKIALVKAGEPIGAIAAQSVGQPTTQMTLNTFHLAGVSQNNVTLGVPRIQELFDASKKMKTPSLRIYLQSKLSEKQLLDLITNKLPERYIGQYIVSSKIYFDWKPEDSQVRQIFKDDMREYSKESTPWVLVLTFDRNRKILFDVWIQITEAILKNFSKFCEVDHNTFSDETLAVELRAKRNSQITTTFYEKLVQINDQIHKLKLGSGVLGIKKVFKKDDNVYVSGLNGKLAKESQTVLETRGSNLRQILSLPNINISKTVSNDIIEVAEVLGIQAARQVFINQFRLVLGCYNIYINFRHLITLADWMCRRGRLTPINRNGINRISEISVLRKASFEETVEMLYDAAVFGEKDPLSGISERIILGQSCSVGTNIFDVVIDRSRTSEFFKINPKDKFELCEQEPVINDQGEASFVSYPIRETPNPYINTPSHIMYSPGPSSTTAVFSPYHQTLAAKAFSPRNSSYNNSSSPLLHQSPVSNFRNYFSSPYYSSSPDSASARSNNNSQWTNSPGYSSRLSGSLETPYHDSPSYSSRQQTPYSSSRQEDDDDHLPRQ